MSILNGINDEIITIQIENTKGLFAFGWDYEKQNSPAQQDSRMSNLKIETENILPQRHSKCLTDGYPGCYAGRMDRMEC